MKEKTLNIKKILHISGFYMENLYIGGKIIKISKTLVQQTKVWHGHWALGFLKRAAPWRGH